MPVFTLHRDHALTEEEWTRLPAGCHAISDGTDLVARAEVERPLGELLAFTAALARGIPDARLRIEIPAANLEVGASNLPVLVGSAPVVVSGAHETGMVPTSATPSPAQTAPTLHADADLSGMNPWDLLDSGDRAGAERVFAAGYELDMNGRDRLRELFNSTDPDTCAFACRVIGATNWKSFATNLRRVLNHADVRVRRDAVTALGKLAGVVMLNAVEPLLNDPSPEVRIAARAAVEAINAKPRPRQGSGAR